MMHLILLAMIINLMMGTAALAVILQTDKSSPSPVLRSLFLYTLFYNLGILLLAVRIYTNLNLPQGFFESHSHSIRQGLFLYITLFEFGMLYALIRIDREFQDLRLSRKMTILIAALVCFFLLSYAITLFTHGPWIRILTRIQSLFWDNVLLLDFLILVLMLARIHKMPSESRRMARGFGWLYLGRYLLIAPMLVLILAPRELRLAVGLIVFIGYNLLPVIWIRCFYLPHARSMTKLLGQNKDLTPFFRSNGLSPREQEILLLLLDGKSNAEIEKALFISYHTVKNHVYNLYQKLGVKNRHQLLHKIARQTSAFPGAAKEEE